MVFQDVQVSQTANRSSFLRSALCGAREPKILSTKPRGPQIESRRRPAARSGSFVRDGGVRCGRRKLISIPAVSISISCAGCISGEVDGDSVPAFLSSALGVATVTSGGEDGKFAIAIHTSLPNTCELAAEFLDDVSSKKVGDQGDAESFVDAAGTFFQERLPADYWVAFSALSGSDIGDANGEDIKIDDQDDHGFSFAAIVCHNKDTPDLNDHLIDFKTECFHVSDGEGAIQFDEDAKLKVKGDVDLEDTDGDDAGDVELSLNAGLCDKFNNSLDSFFDNGFESQAEGTVDASCNLTFSVMGAGIAGDDTSIGGIEGEGNCVDTCEFGCDGICEEPGDCEPGTDTVACGGGA